MKKKLAAAWHQDVDAWRRWKTPPAWRRTQPLPIVFRRVAAMPDVHFGIGATVGSVIRR